MAGGEPRRRRMAQKIEEVASMVGYLSIPGITGQSKSIGRDRGTRRTRSGVRERPRGHGDGAGLAQAAQERQ